MRGDKSTKRPSRGKKNHPKQSAACKLAHTLKPRCFLSGPRRLNTPLPPSSLLPSATETIKQSACTSALKWPRRAPKELSRPQPTVPPRPMSPAVRPGSPLSWGFLSGCTGRGLDTRLGLLLTLLALTEFIWGVGDLEETSKPSQQKRRRLVYVFLFSGIARSAMFSLLLMETHCFSGAVPPHCCYVLPRPTEAGGAIMGRHGPSGLGHITWEDLSACTAAHSTA